MDDFSSLRCCPADEIEAEDIYGEHAPKGWENSWLDPRPEAELF